MNNYSDQKEKIMRMNNPGTIEEKIKRMNIELSLLRSRLSVLRRVETQTLDLEKKKLKLKDTLETEGLRDEIKYTINTRQKMLMKNLLKNPSDRKRLKKKLNPLDFFLLNVFSFND